MTYDHTAELLDGLGATARSIRDEAAAVSEYIGRLTEAVAAIRSDLADAEHENSELRSLVAELRAQLAGRTNDTTTATTMEGVR